MERFVKRFLNSAIVFILLTRVCVRCNVSVPICCFPDQYESLMIGSQGSVNPDTQKYAYINGTVRSTYDGVNMRSYLFENVTVWLSIWPVDLPVNWTYIFDYKNNVSFEVYADGTCDRRSIGQPMYPECIPGNATLMSEGTFGAPGVKIKTYQFADMIYADGTQVTVYVVLTDENRSECQPIYSSLTDSYSQPVFEDYDVTGLSIVDFTKGIKDTSVFEPPDACFKYPINIL